jgi:hypothetical protein
MARRPIAAALADADDVDQGADDQRDVVASNTVQDDIEELEDDVEELEDDAGQVADDLDEPQQREPRQRRVAVREPAVNPDLMARLEAAERRAEAAERTAREAAERHQQRQEPVETPEQEAARLALMTPVEQQRYFSSKIDKALANHDQRVQRGVLQAANSADKASFEAFVADKPQMKKIAVEVERKHAELLSQGSTPSRMDVMKYMLGEQALKAAQTPAARREDAARRERVQRQQTRPGTANSDVRGQRRGERTLEDRLANVQI